MIHCSISRWVIAVCIAGSTWSLATVGFGQVVQLPTVGTFAYSGTVQVPDQGAIIAGSVGSTQLGVKQYGKPRSRALGTSSSQGNVSVHAHIIDLEEIDRQIMGEAPANDPSLRSSRVPPRVNHQSLRSLSSPVAEIYAAPLPGEDVPPAANRRRRTLRDFTSGDYMMLLSHPGLIQAAHQ